jgi:endo-1,4-beta-D-glucanase Y
MKRLLVCLLVLTLAVPGFALAQGGTPVPAGVTGELLYIPFPVAIAVDGDLSDWADVPHYTVDKGPNLSGDPAENGSFTVALAASADTFYITMTMADRNIVAGQHGTNFWNEDSLEFYLNLTGDFYAPVYTKGMYQVNINAADIGNTDPGALTPTGTNSDTLPLSGYVFKTDEGWGFEAEVPLAGLFEIAHGAEIGFQAQANGATQADRDVKLIWSNADTGDTSWQDPTVFGRAIFYELGQTDVPQPSGPPADDESSGGFDWAGLPWGEIVRATWEGYKANYIFCGEQCGNNLGLVFDPNMGYQAVSEGVGYGLLMAVMMDDQATFDTVYDAAHDIMLDPATGLLNWRVDNTGAITGETSATDAEEDIAAALIFAQSRVDRGEWAQHAERPYGDSANALIDAIYTYEVADGRYLTPGDAWDGEGQEILNLSYFAPAWYRIFDDFQGTDRWQPVITYGYRSLFTTDGAPLGLAPDWSTSDGGPAYDYCDAHGRERSACLYEMTFDAIRVPWRIGLDCLWFDEARACQWSGRTAEFLKALPPDQFGRLYDMDGVPVVSYQNEMMDGMWLVASLASGDEELQQQLAQQLYTVTGNALTEGYWGGSAQYYFNQSLAWFGASLLSGDFQNLYYSAD